MMRILPALSLLIPLAGSAFAEAPSRALVDKVIAQEDMIAGARQLGDVFRAALQNHEGLIPEAAHAKGEALVKAYWDSAAFHGAMRDALRKRIDKKAAQKHVAAFDDPRFQRLRAAMKKTPESEAEWRAIADILGELDGGRPSPEIAARAEPLSNNALEDSLKEVFKERFSRAHAIALRALNAHQPAAFRLDAAELEKNIAANDARLGQILDGNFLLAVGVFAARDLPLDDLRYTRARIDSEANRSFERLKSELMGAHLDAFLARFETELGN